MKDRNTLMDITLGSYNMPDIIMVKKNGVKTRFIPDLGQPDPYAHLKEAQARGEIIQENLDYYCLGEKTFWVEKAKNVNFIGEPDRYRIKPKTKTLYKWAYRDKVTKSWKETDRWMESEDDFKNDYLWAKDEFKRLDYTAIEVEV